LSEDWEGSVNTLSHIEEFKDAMSFLVELGTKDPSVITQDIWLENIRVAHHHLKSAMLVELYARLELSKRLHAAYVENERLKSLLPA
jgi:hypothetical protein